MVRLPEITEANQDQIAVLRETFIRERRYLKRLLRQCPVECQDEGLNWRFVFDKPEEIDTLITHLRGPIRRKEAIMATQQKHAGPKTPPSDI